MTNLESLVEQFPLPGKPGKRLELGLIGLGGIFEHSHLPSLKLMLEAGWPVNVAAICDVSERRLEAMRGVFPRAKTFTDARALMAEGKCSAILAFTPPAASEGIVEDAIARKVPLFVEKPVSHSAAKLDELAERAEKGRVAVQVAYNRRSQPLVGKFRELIEELPAPGARHVVARFWRANRTEPIFYPDTLGHPLDLLAYCFGPLEIQQVQRWAPANGSGLFSGVQVTLKAGEVTLELDSRPAVGRACETYEVIGEGVQVSLSYSPVDKGGDAVGLRRFEMREEKALTRIASSDLSVEGRSYMRGFAHQLAGFFRLAAGEESKPICTLRDAAAAMRLVGKIENRK